MKVSEILGVTPDKLDCLDTDVPKDKKEYIDPNALFLLKDHFFDTNKAAHRLYDFFYTLLDYHNRGEDNKVQQILSEVHEINDTYLGDSKRKAEGKGPDYNALQASLGRINRLINSVNIHDNGEIALPMLFTLFVPNFGKDSYSDLITNVIYIDLLNYTRSILEHYNHKDYFIENEHTHHYWNIATHNWSEVTGEFRLQEYPTLLVPKKVLKKYYTSNEMKYIRAIILTIKKEEWIEEHGGKITKKEIFKMFKNDYPDLSNKQRAEMYATAHPETLDRYMQILG